MTAYGQQSAFQNPKRTESVRNLDHLETRRLCRALRVFTPEPAQIAQLIEQAKNHMPIRASTEAILKVSANNPDCFWGIRRAIGLKGRTSESAGFVAFLMLNRQGREALLSGKFDPAFPEDEYLVGQHEKPDAIYVWALYARGALTPALGLVMDKLQSPNYRTANFVARAATPEGENFLTSLGFTKKYESSGLSFHHFERRFGTASPQFHIGEPQSALASSQGSDSQNRPLVSAKIVHDVSELMQTISIRSVVYMGEERCPYNEEFDGNDFSSTHIIGHVGLEPAGCLRIRYFSGFAKLERLAVRQEHRGFGLGRELVRVASDLCRVKGYTRLYAHVRSDKVDFWSRYGFTLSDKSQSFVFSDYQYIEMCAEIEQHDTPITIGIDPYIILRREGEWDTPGNLEASQLRAFAS